MRKVSYSAPRCKVWAFFFTFTTNQNMNIFAIFRTKKGTDQAQFAGQVSELVKQKATAVAKKVTGEKAKSMTCCDGDVATVSTENYRVDFAPKEVLRGFSKPEIDL